jgi:hypothetical protein
MDDTKSDPLLQYLIEPVETRKEKLANLGPMLALLDLDQFEVDTDDDSLLNNMVFSHDSDASIPASPRSPSVLSRSDSNSSKSSAGSATTERSVASTEITAPSVGPNLPTLNDQIANMAIADTPEALVLSCIFGDILGCAVPLFNDTEVWMRHVISHFDSYGPPTHALCIFCDRSFENHNASQCWREYLDHVADEFRSGCTMGGYRPDFRVLQYLAEHDILDGAECARLCTEGSERPPVNGLMLVPLDELPKDLKEKQAREKKRNNCILMTESRRERRELNQRRRRRW